MTTEIDLSTFRQAVKRWASKNLRDFAWRQNQDPYKVLVSEVMLQQTTVAAVGPYFKRFIEQFPTVTSLAEAEEGVVLRAWEGLGYYSRAKNLHRAAKFITTQLGGIFPQTLNGLCELPGVGRYTAGAVMSFAYNQPAPIVEANTQRLYARLLGTTEAINSRVAQAALWQFAEQIVPAKDPGRFNLALMDLGALVCTVKQPRCDECPLISHCAAAANQLQSTIPKLPPKPLMTPVLDATVAVQCRGKWLVRKRLRGEHWAGLWDFARYTLAEGKPGIASIILPERSVRRTLAERLLNDTQLNSELQDRVLVMKHGVTRYKIELWCYTAKATTCKLPANSPYEWKWVTTNQLSELPMSVTGRKFALKLSDLDSNRQQLLPGIAPETE
jgi:A/G-specific adenine glycosylase